MSACSIFRKAALAGLVCAFFAGAASAANFGFASFHALIKPTGEVARGSGVKAVTHPSVGRYLVQFIERVNVSACVYTATPSGAYGGQASVQVVAGKPDTLAVFTFSKAGVPTNTYFNLLVTCGDQYEGMTIMSANVMSDGYLAYGSGAVSASYNASYKEYAVRFRRSIVGCSSVVTPRFQSAIAMTHDQNLHDGPLLILFTDDAGNNVARDFHVIVFCGNR